MLISANEKPEGVGMQAVVRWLMLLKRKKKLKLFFLSQELMEKLKMPSDADLMKIAITDLNNSSISLEDRQRALQELLVLVEPIDNANG